MFKHLSRYRTKPRDILERVDSIGNAFDIFGSLSVRISAVLVRFLYSSQRPEGLCGLASPLSNGYRGLFPWQGRKSDPSPTSGAEVRNSGAMLPRHHVFMS
jgi:hypothetical protein